MKKEEITLREAHNLPFKAVAEAPTIAPLVKTGLTAPPCGEAGRALPPKNQLVAGSRLPEQSTLSYQVSKNGIQAPCCYRPCVLARVTWRRFSSVFQHLA